MASKAGEGQWPAEGHSTIQQVFIDIPEPVWAEKMLKAHQHVTYSMANSECIYTNVSTLSCLDCDTTQ